MPPPAPAPGEMRWRRGNNEIHLQNVFTINEEESNKSFPQTIKELSRINCALWWKPLGCKHLPQIGKSFAAIGTCNLSTNHNFVTDKVFSFGQMVNQLPSPRPDRRVARQRSARASAAASGVLAAFLFSLPTLAIQQQLPWWCGDDVMLTRFRFGKLKTDLLTFNFIKLYNPGGEWPLLPSTQTVIVSKIKQLGAAGAGHSCVAQQCIVTRGPGSRSTLVLDLTPSRPARRHHRYLHNLFSRH